MVGDGCILVVSPCRIVTLYIPPEVVSDEYTHLFSLLMEMGSCSYTFAMAKGGISPTPLLKKTVPLWPILRPLNSTWRRGLFLNSTCDVRLNDMQHGGKKKIVT